MTKRFANSVGENILGLAYHLGGVGMLAKQAFVQVLRRPMHVFLVVEQVYAIGVKSFGSFS